MSMICGASGMLGRTLCKILKKNNISYVGTYNQNKYEDFVKLNFFDTTEIKTFIIKNNIDTIINLIAERRPNICENDWKHTCEINIKIVENLITVCNDLNLHLIHISTDYVFDGLSSPYNPESLTNPLQNYGISKLMGELRIRNMCSSYLIIRVPVLYSLEQKNLNESSVTVIGKKLMNISKEHIENNYYIRRPVSCNELSLFIIKSIKEQTQGIKHFNNPYDKYTKYGIGKIISKILRLKLKPDDIINTKVLRPYDTELVDIDTHEYISRVKIDLGTIFQKYYYPTIKTNISNYILLLDLDGTIITENVHHNVYRDLLVEHDINFTYEDYLKATNNSSVEKYIKEVYKLENDVVNKLVKRKRIEIINTKYPIKLIEGFTNFLTIVLRKELNIVVVTNSPKSYIESVKRKIPLLNKIKQWVTREDYKNPKPSKEPYEVAMNKYGKDEKYVIGFENSRKGIESLLQVTNHIYGYVRYSNLEDYDIYQYSNYFDVIKHMF